MVTGTPPAGMHGVFLGRVDIERGIVRVATAQSLVLCCFALPAHRKKVIRSLTVSKQGERNAYELVLPSSDRVRASVKRLCLNLMQV